MKQFWAVIVALLGLVAVGLAQDPKLGSGTKIYPASEAKSLVGKHAVVMGKVVQVRQEEKITHINFEKPYPYHEFTAVVYASRANLFTNLGKLVGSTVEVRGKVEQYKDKPQIVLQSPSQLKVILEKSK